MTFFEMTNYSIASCLFSHFGTITRRCNALRHDEQRIDELPSFSTVTIYPVIRFFDIVFVLRTDNSALFDRLHQRNYNQSKIDNNLQCEIFQTILDEAQESYDGNIVHELRSDSTEDLEQNLEKIALWIQSWSPNQS